jgi:hypothetical protein
MIEKCLVKHETKFNRKGDELRCVILQVPELVARGPITACASTRIRKAYSNHCLELPIRRISKKLTNEATYAYLYDATSHHPQKRDFKQERDPSHILLSPRFRGIAK